MRSINLLVAMGAAHNVLAIPQELTTSTGNEDGQTVKCQVSCDIAKLRDTLLTRNASSSTASVSPERFLTIPKIADSISISNWVLKKLSQSLS